ncbi:MAG: GNAT family N-acetyltransferase [Spirochaetia bacterium]
MKSENVLSGQIILEKAIRERLVVIRYPVWEDLYSFMRFRNELHEEQVMCSHQEMDLPKSCDHLCQILKKLETEKERRLFIFLDDQLVGEANATKNYTGLWITIGIMLSRKARGLGLGRLVMNLLEEEARKLGSTRLSLTVWEENTVAVELYRKIGYREVGKLPEWEPLPRGGRTGLIYMVKEILD